MSSLDQIEFFPRDGMTCFRVRVQPKASKNALIGPYGKTLKVRLTAPPSQGQANRQLQRFLAKLLDLDKADVSIVSGLHSRTKTVGILNRSRTELLDRLAQYLV